MSPEVRTFRSSAAFGCAGPYSFNGTTSTQQGTMFPVNASKRLLCSSLLGGRGKATSDFLLPFHVLICQNKTVLRMLFPHDMPMCFAKSRTSS